MKKLLVAILFGMMVVGIGCGDDDDKGTELCEPCQENDDCKDDLDCAEIYDITFGFPVGSFCVDSPTRVCEYVE